MQFVCSCCMNSCGTSRLHHSRSITNSPAKPGFSRSEVLGTRRKQHKIRIGRKGRGDFISTSSCFADPPRTELTDSDLGAQDNVGLRSGHSETSQSACSPTQLNPTSVRDKVI